MVKLSLPEHPGRDSANCLAHVTKPEGADHHIWLDGKDSFIGFTTAWGESPREAKRRGYRTVENMVLSPEVQYRRDIGETVELHINLLKGWGWI
ncbi:MAG: hypothetical protein UU06_C0012G0005 [Parcubacteria group bacterium GW2011_GWB1_40_5]|nr:MAG: hypothetical protein UU06_C0012G0005 [Parcubacteria group bacterium GW2011_GWB1_40_5]